MTETTKELTTRAKNTIRVPATSVRRPAEGADAPATFLAVIAAAAADPRCDVNKMQALLDMQQQVEDREAKKQFNDALMAVQHEMPPISRDGRIVIPPKDGKRGQSTPYATFNNIMKTVQPILLRNGLRLSFATEPVGEKLLVRGFLTGYGHTEQTSFPLPAETSGSKNNVQGWGSSMSYGKRYCTIALLNIVSEAPEDADTDGNQGKFVSAKDGGIAAVSEDRPISKAQAAEIRNAIEDGGISEVNFCTHYGLAKLDDLPSSLFDAAKKAIADHKAKRNA